MKDILSIVLLFLFKKLPIQPDHHIIHKKGNPSKREYEITEYGKRELEFRYRMNVL